MPFTFHFQGLTVMKIDGLKKCYAWPLLKDEPTPDSIDLGLKQVRKNLTTTIFD